MKLYLPKLNTSLLTYYTSALLGVLVFLYNDADTRYLYIILSLAFVLILTASCFNALTFKSYRTVLWPFIVNVLLLLAFLITNGGISNVPFFGSDNSSLFIFFLMLGFNSHWYMLIESSLISDFNFLVINTFLSFIIPSLGYALGYIYTAKMKQNN